MKKKVSIAIAVAAFAGLFPGAAILRAQSDTETALQEATTALEAAVAGKVRLEEKVTQAENVRISLAESLAAANAEAAQYRDSYREVRMQMEALGIEAIEPGSGGIEERLLKAVNDIRLLEDEKQALASQLMRLSEATMNYMQTALSPSADARVIVEEELGNAEASLASRPKPHIGGKRGLEGGRVIGLKPGYG
ncbi:MAG: hypothetical protein ACC661_12865, partial [Verrucomicrobiales bacterium]